MRLFERMGLLLKADAHGMLDNLEERRLLLKQHLREAELELGRKRARAEALEEEERRLTEDAERFEAEVTALDEDVELALSGGKQDLARFAVRRLLPKRQLLVELRSRIDEIGESRRRLAERLATQEQEFEQMGRRVRARLAAARTEELAGPGLSEAAVADEEVELELLRRCRPPAATGGAKQ